MRNYSVVLFKLVIPVVKSLINQKNMKQEVEKLNNKIQLLSEKDNN